MPSLSDIDLLALLTNGSADRIISGFDIQTATYSVAAATLSGGFYLPKRDMTVIPNPAGRKGLISMIYSTDGINFYPQRYRLYQPGNPVPAGRLGAVAGMACDDNYIYIFFTHYLGAQQDFTMKYVVDNIL